jgi:hypothetical protein
VSAVFAPASPWYCAALRGASQALARLAHRLDQQSRRDEPAASAGDLAPHELLRTRERAEEELREIRLRSLRYY